MLPFHLRGAANGALNILCLGAHSDDLEIGCAGAVMELLKRYAKANVTWVVLSAAGERAGEARRSAEALLRRAARKHVVVGGFTDGYFPGEFREIKLFLEQVARSARPDIILTHRLEDRHQDHRITAELTWQTWRDQLVFEYEIPKYEGDLGQPNLYVPLSAAIGARKLRHLSSYFGTQRNRAWFRPQTFEAVLRLRGIECRAASGLAEGFQVRKAVF